MRFTIVIGTERLKYIFEEDFLKAMNDYKWCGYEIIDYLPFENHLVLVMKKL